MTKLSGDIVRHQLKTNLFGQNVIYTEQIGSTNTELKQLAVSNAPEGLLYLTDEQLAGRGRLGRSWYAPPYSSLLFSLLFRPGDFLAPSQAQRITMISALALADAVQTETGFTPKLKWPNDLLGAGNKKLAGILTELGIEEERLSWVVVGLGLNLNIDFTSDKNGLFLFQTATSLSMILKRESTSLRLPILQKFLRNVERRYTALRQGEQPHYQWRSRLVGLGKAVTVTAVDGKISTGIMDGVNEDGALLIKLADGSIETVLAGEVSLSEK